MAVFQSAAAKGVESIRDGSDSGDAQAQRCTYSLTTALAVGDIIELACIPANHRVVDMIFDSDALDSNASKTISWDIGIMSGDWGDQSQSRTCGAEFFSGSTISRTGLTERPSLKTAFRDTQTAKDRSIGVKLTALAATFAAGTISVVVFYVVP